MDINVIFTGQIGIGRVLFHVYRQELTKAMLGAKKDISYITHSRKTKSTKSQKIKNKTKIMDFSQVFFVSLWP